MKLFGRRHPEGTTGDATENFWSWWNSGGSAMTARAIEGGDSARFTEPLTTRIGAINAGLAWEFGAGTNSRHLLVVTADGQPELRATARKWLQSAPPADATWAYADTRPAVTSLAGMELTVGAHVIRFEDMSASVTPRGAGVDIAVFHPRFIHVPEHARDQLIQLATEAALGEDRVSRWVKTITAEVIQPIVTRPLVELPAQVDALAAEHSYPNGEPRWATMRGSGPRGPMQATAMVPLTPAVSPDLDTHVEVTVTYAYAAPDGFPDATSQQSLRDLEQRVATAVWPQGRVVAHETSEGVRVLHFFVVTESTASLTVEQMARQWTEGPVSVRSSYDPGWLSVQHLRP